ncbi:VWA domain-containing protein [Janthinobacterium sp. PLB04]|uniref:VWA domain-containing protein n=1 Tax=Janthinobacterium lividum TaxID=29581 RepID=A0AAJ4T7Q3_9BURK|nr:MULTISPECIES: VWA domain-containing protein [Janthinobacterium]KAB0324407.1 VWA domain-containing protein [Janthinobacterium lividum]QSX98507.1 VWA domain-containing protein [Janthinobacterium lividum]UGQ38467.1 VWA domain-containing protein [Janthinobacterium sp. PLB04]
MKNDADLIDRWRAAWPEALAAWSKFTRLRDPNLCASRVEASRQGLSGSFAMIRLLDQSVVVDLPLVTELGLDDYALEVLAHEIGHHILAPGSASDQFRLLARMRRALPTLEQHAPMVANLYTDLFINDRLQRQANLRMADIYRKLQQGRSAQADAKGSGGVWTLYMRIYENLWQLQKGELGGGSADERLDTDAWLGARLIRVYANDWMLAAGRFATLLLPYLVEDTDALSPSRYLLDTRDAARGCQTYGAQQIEDDEADGAIHPVHDKRISGLDGEEPVTEAPARQGGGQLREPFELGDILKASGVNLSDHEIAIRYYRERALPHLVAFPSRPAPESQEPQMEGLEAWEIGDPLEDIDWLQSVMQSPRPVPGVTTVRRVYGREPARATDAVPVDLDMYVDSSGSMPNPQAHTSFLTLAGAVIALSALRAGAKVQVTLWSGKNEVMQTPGFVRDEDMILGVLTEFFGGGTCFPIHRLRQTYAARRERPAHILMISDDGITTMFDKDELGNSGWDISAKALAQGGAGGTMALNLERDWDGAAAHKWLQQTYDDLKRARREQGWDIHAVERYEDLLDFARAFSRRHYIQQ